MSRDNVNRLTHIGLKLLVLVVCLVLIVMAVSCDSVGYYDGEPETGAICMVVVEPGVGDSPDEHSRRVCHISPDEDTHCFYFEGYFDSLTCYQDEENNE